MPHCWLTWLQPCLFCNVSLLLLLFNLKASSVFVAEELCRGVRLTLLDLFRGGTFSDAISSSCFTLTSLTSSILVTKSSSLLPCIQLRLAMRRPFSKWILRFNKKSCLASSSSESAGFATSLSGTGGMFVRISWISLPVKSVVFRTSFTAWSLFSWKQMFYLPVLLHVDCICFS